MIYAISAFIICFLLLASGLLLMFHRGEAARRLSAILPDQAEASLWDRIDLKKHVENLGALAASVEPTAAQPGTSTPSVQRQKLVLAGLRSETQANLFHASRVITPIVLLAIVVLMGWYQWSPLVFLAGSLALGYLLPDYWLGHRMKVREEALRSGLPDLLDVMVVCLEAGLSLDQAAMRASAEMRFAHPVVADELGLVMLEIRAGQGRMDAWRNLATRTGEETVKMLVSVLVQADQFGTGISKTLRVHADSVRTKRRNQVEELAHKTTVKLVFPLVLFIFPSFLITVLGPVVIIVSEAFEK